jgi:hypothetical protein
MNTAKKPAKIYLVHKKVYAAVSSFWGWVEELSQQDPAYDKNSE